MEPNFIEATFGEERVREDCKATPEKPPEEKIDICEISAVVVVARKYESTKQSNTTFAHTLEASGVVRVKYSENVLQSQMFYSSSEFFCGVKLQRMLHNLKYFTH
ncbi:hypothetical protein NPIL_554331 [Nephila pilipes]|uniref:Uncharacterized protein n=1 Tax=Nephila pilipes TaxID=299642 RepID=A0A8X6J497_NEPPI|nr:hypothetical protein NPIL_554331 [Nephila pilipes]